ncbi:multidrug resistance efflux pump [Thermanaerovibrio velox DSM 12556]|uniref:Multidrug resistance efflux pump n=1 Tax=Thermanaerovibrio velox DSM 12556 TaxID=926567 RepID=H0UQQ3_9BACT|nr:HlyD family efflux transporter periplasmic adaptor subunit [Thermanaerovibrio velox]EHM10817.1 multidrug resistance efflux pump [Thermanaerovibrio velox DSM 12556]
MKISFSPKKVREDVDRGVRVEYGPPKRAFLRWRWYALLLVVSSPLILLLWRATAFYLLASAPGVLVMERRVISSPLGGVVASLSLRPGDRVGAGDVLFVVKDPSAPLRANALREELRALKGAGLKAAALRPGSGQEALVRANRLNLSRQMEYLRSVETLFRQGAATRAELEEARGRLEAARAALAQSSALLEPQEVDDTSIRQYEAQRRARIAQLEGELKALEGTLERTVASPEDGVILEVFAPQGHGVALGGPVLSLGSLGDVRVICYLDPRKLGRSSPGVPVTVRFPDGRKLPGHVEGSPVLSVQDPRSDGRSVLVPVRLDRSVEPQSLVDSLPVTVSFPLCPQYLGGICGLFRKVFD